MNHRPILLIAALLCFSGYLTAQKYIKPFVGINFSNRILSSDDSHRKDSLDAADKMKVFPGIGAQFIFEKELGREVYIGLNYSENGFERERRDYKFLDSVHDLGKLYDLSQGAQKNAYFTYHFKYLELPVGLNYQLTRRQQMNLYTGWFNIGLVPQYLIKQNMTIFLEGFSMNGKSRFNYSNTGYKANKFNMAIQTGGRFDVNVKSKFWVTFDALMRIQLLPSASNSYDKLRVYHFTANLGIKYQIGDY